MEFLDLAKNRYSVRKFTSEPVSDADIEKILEAAYVAPTACNKQPQKIFVVKSAEGLEKFRRCTECHFNAPLGFIICCDKSACWKRSFDGKLSSDVDASIVTTHMMLEAAALGLGSTWVMYFIPEAVRTEFDLPDDMEPIALLPVGHPASDAQPSPQHTSFRNKAETVEYV